MFLICMSSYKSLNVGSMTNRVGNFNMLGIQILGDDIPLKNSQDSNCFILTPKSAGGLPPSLFKERGKHRRCEG